MPALALKTHDTWPSVEATLAVGAVALPLADATVRFILARHTGTGLVPVLNKPAVVVDTATGAVRYDWAAEDTALAGTYYGEFRVTFADTRRTTVPNDRVIEITIIAGLPTT